MKKFWLFIVSILLVVPFSVSAENINTIPVDYNDLTGGAYFNDKGNTRLSYYWYKMRYGKYAGEGMYCIDVGNPSPRYITQVEDIDTSYGFGKGLAAIFAATDALGASFVTANDAARIFTSLYNASGYGVSFWFYPEALIYKDQMIEMFRNAGYTLSGLSKPYKNVATISGSSPNYSKLQKAFCAGVIAYGQTSSDVYKGCNSNVSGIPNVTGGSNSGNLNVNMYEDSTKTRRNTSSDRIFSQFVGAKVIISPSDAKIKITGCSVNNSNYECSISSDYLNKEISNNEVIEVLVQSKNNDLNTDATQVNVNINYSFAGGKSYTIKEATCSGGGCANYSSSSYLDQWVQRMLLITTKPGDSNGTAVLGVNVPKACQHEDDNYKVGNKTVSVKEYMEYGCCSDINVKDLTNSDDLNYYKDTCMDDDIVSFSNVCGSSLGCLERDGDYKNNKYVGYSKS